MKYSIVNIKAGKRERAHIIYAQVNDEAGGLCVNATLDYCVEWVKAAIKQEQAALTSEPQEGIGLLPEGYYVYQESEDKKSLVVGMDFRHMGKECVPAFEYEGRVFIAGPIEPIPDYRAVKICCMRTYTAR